MFKTNHKKKTKINKLDSQPISTVIGASINIKGDIQGKSTVRIDGTLEGNVAVENGIVLGEKGKIIGNVQSNHVVVYGTITGNIKCKELLLKNAGMVNGDIDTHTIEIELGGKYNGQLSMQSPTTPTK